MTIDFGYHTASTSPKTHREVMWRHRPTCIQILSAKPLPSRRQVLCSFRRDERTYDHQHLQPVAGDTKRIKKAGRVAIPGYKKLEHPMVDNALSHREQIERAIAAHKLWKEHLDEAISSGVSDISVDHAENDKDCEFGRWLNSNLLPSEFKGSDMYRTIHDCHSTFHMYAARLLAISITDDISMISDKSFLTKMNNIVSSRLINLLEQWLDAEIG